MNKTLKTIGWICLALGILGILADAGAIVISRRFVADGLAAGEEIQGTAQYRTNMQPGQPCIAQDTDGDGKPDGDCIQQPDRPQGFAPRQGDRIGGGMMKSPSTTFNRRAAFGFGGLPIFLFALGPVLAVMGAVTLLVNRKPREKSALEVEKESTKDKSAK